MIQFQKLRLSGFKSFVDHSELLINTGLTGVVGPNGCGKSNLVEALRWVMGETSAKQMRGGEMDDVIFAGSSNRPARNVAEVSVLLDNSNYSAPALFNEELELSVTRRIERSKGSNYKVNGRDVRARDVQLLFADAATGARSTAMVSQGKIGAIISAKPQARRSILEEAAGISGLHSRRHEAELRLRSAETNLGRLDDVLSTLDTQQKNLQKQARQASRYRSLSDRIRKADSLLFHLRWLDALAEMDKAREAFQAADQRVQDLTQRAAQASKVQAEASAHLPALREAEAAAAAQLQRLSIAREQLDAEEQRLGQTRADLVRRLDQANQDVQREQDFRLDAQTAQDRLQTEHDQLQAQGEEESFIHEEALERVTLLKEELESLERQLNEQTAQRAQRLAQRDSVQKQLNAAQQRVTQLQNRQQNLQRDLEQLTAQTIDPADLERAEMQLEESQEAVERSEFALEQAEQHRLQTREAVQQALQAVREREAILAKLEAEEEALVELLDPAEGRGDGVPIMDDVMVQAGYEMALGSALGDDLTAPHEGEGPLHWRMAYQPDDQGLALPQGVIALADYVTAPAVLAARLKQIGVVETLEEAEAAFGQLKQGQRLVTKEGGLWRWDGYVALQGTPSAAAVRLKQKNRLRDLREQWEIARAQSDAAEDALGHAQEGEEQADQGEKTAREALKNHTQALAQAQNTVTALTRQQAAMTDKRNQLDEMLDHVGADLEAAQEERVILEEQALEVAEDETAEAQLETLQETVQAKRGQVRDCENQYDALQRESAARHKRLHDIRQELETWAARTARAQSHLADLQARQEQLQEELEVLNEQPEEIAEKRESLLESIALAEEKRRECADILAEAESKLRDVDGFARQAELELTKCREDRIRYESHVSQGKQLCMGLAERIRERLDCKPEELPALAEITDGADLPDMGSAEKSVDRLYRERDTMGPVNLRAETELEELTEKVETMTREREDLLKAIGKLRQGINELNHEGRERLLVSFNEVNQHFQTLFVRLFGGGEARLELIEDDDPLNAGLEIMASPPGKRMQILSLLSGGEQALTALALLFGVFLTNPAPICVLDEVDAPLDDANVDRFCTMLEEMSKSGQTRFLIITHHRMTMARMHRLFGVTMTERGVSQLVSVDLQKAAALVDS